MKVLACAVPASAGTISLASVAIPILPLFVAPLQDVATLLADIGARGPSRALAWRAPWCHPEDMPERAREHHHAADTPGTTPSRGRVGSLAAIMGVCVVALAAVLLSIALGFARSAPRVAAVMTTTMWIAFVVLVALGGVAAASFARADARRRAAERESGRRTAMLEAEIAAHRQTGAKLARAREAAEAANEAKTRYLVAMSHEIRSPLNAIYGYAQLLERDETMSGAEAGRVIRRSAEHVTNLVETLLDISRIESGVVRLRSDIVDVPALFEGILDMFLMQAASKGLTLQLELSDRLPRYTRTDERRLRQMLINLISNAIKYTDAGGATIVVGYRSQVADIEVRDTGPGIDPDDVERIFQPFERGSGAAAQRQPGIGLGLAITRALARVMGGDIEVRSRPGEGSSFRLRLLLPALANPPSDQRERAGRLTGYEGATRTILAIDDDAAQRGAMQNLLQPLGFTVHAAACGADGLVLAAAHPVDLVLLDIQMPGLSGWETASRLRAAHGARLRIVMVSADAHELHAGGDGSSAHDAFVTKPVAFDTLLGVIGTQLGLVWRQEPEAATVAAPASAVAVPVEASARLAALRSSAKVGDVRGIERALDALAKEAPEASALVATLRGHAAAFDLRSFVRVLDEVGHG